MTALAADIGTGNIVGVSTAIYIGGPGALFWMWVTALVGMATKFSEVLLSVHFREKTPAGNWVGGAMYFIKNGLGPKWMWLGSCFALFGIVACIGTALWYRATPSVKPYRPTSPSDVVYCRRRLPAGRSRPHRRREAHRCRGR